LHALQLGDDPDAHPTERSAYRYYVCLGASRRGHETCPVRSIAAGEVEGLVLGQVRRLLASPELVARTLAEAGVKIARPTTQSSRRAK
jgi:recombinase-like zinc beta ribbon protein